jgi:vancomycin permeability regulator SanA
MIRNYRQYHLNILLLLEFGLLIVVPTIYAKLSTSYVRYNANDISLQTIPKRDVAIVFGAGVLPSGQPTEYLRNRILTGVNLYKAGRVSKIVMSGDNSSVHYNEPDAMKRYAVTLGVSASAIVEDFAGYSTYDTCYRAGAIFGIKRAIVVTQGYHLPRAVMTCRSLGIDTIGVAASREGKDSALTYIAREYLSTDKAIVELVVRPKPAVLGTYEPIY